MDVICRRKGDRTIKKWYRVQKLKAIFVLALAIVFTNAVVSYSNTVKLIHNQEWVTSSYEVITQVEKIQSTLKDTETAQRNYLITVDADDLKTYLAADQQTNRNIQILRKLTANNHQKQQWISLLEPKITSRLDILQQEIYLRQNQGFEAVKKRILSDKDNQSSKEIQQLIHDSLEVEQNLLHQGMQQSQANSQKAVVTFFIAAIVDLVLVALLYDLLWHYIRQLQQTELALRQSENRLRAMIDAEPECIKLIAKDGTLLEINAEGLAMMEVESADVLIGKPIDAVIVPEYRAAFANLHKSICQGNKGTLEFEIVGFKGTRRYMESHAVPLRNESDGTFIHLALMRDITQQKHAEQKIREQGLLLDVSTEGIIVRNIHNQILFWNQGAERLYGWKAEEVVGKNVLQLLYKDISPQLEDAYLKVINTGEWRGELHQLTKEGKVIIVESRWILIRDDNGQTKSILSVNTEITQQKQLEAQLLRSQRLESIGTLAGGIVHDLNNILSPILMSVQILQKKLPDSQSQQILQTLENNVKRGANLLKQVLSFARGIEGKRTIVQIQPLMAEMEQIIAQTFPKSIICQVDIPKNLWYVRGDTTQIHQVLINLVVNARDAMPNGGILRIAAENLVIGEHSAQINIDAKVGSYIAIVVTDTGMGMSLEVQQRIFEPFFTTKEVGKGTGLGLSTALGIIKNHGGFVNVYSQVGRGTQFTVYLPASTFRDTHSLSPELESVIGDG
ncbi:histidine kinase [Nostoc sp. 'Peltigera membranacea cyanobiont' 213]|uniref:PAS domain S-box protein n=1 Tax=Nostoc sp. 'Peltigera membranacea cyanobiont' 213 TaxID=2014530 RepID=UPI000B9582BF|nr:PAS domain S-box protein [Nostoc sp. 'Peltigera membranacea cyanobiont' 213]OYD94296.1 histidine kinase [Nostoc sp. 'Peltigera membranacea cyanobiont' 213]